MQNRALSRQFTNICESYARNNIYNWEYGYVVNKKRQFTWNYVKHVT